MTRSVISTSARSHFIAAGVGAAQLSKPKSKTPTAKTAEAPVVEVQQNGMKWLNGAKDTWKAEKSLLVKNRFQLLAAGSAGDPPTDASGPGKNMEVDESADPAEQQDINNQALNEKLTKLWATYEHIVGPMVNITL